MSQHTILDRVNSPLDLKTLTLEEMNQLAAEIRQMIIEVVSQNGGHLAPNLGVVELTIALHRVFDSPRDKLIFDVGHQAYIHKILTGRKQAFPTLRQYKGISGFPKRQESPHDIFGVGHSSTSLSVSSGILTQLLLCALSQNTFLCAANCSSVSPSGVNFPFFSFMPNTITPP